MAPIQIVVVFLSLIVTLAFFLYGSNSYYLLSARRRYRAPADPDAAFAAPSSHRVAIHLPIFNEKYVARRLIRACAAAAEEYDVERVKILVIDDSTDDTTAVLLDETAMQKRRGIDIEVIHRPSREGFKAGALQLGLERSTEDFLAVFDADFIPPADFLVKAIPFLERDAGLGVVQSCWSHLNADYSPITRAISLGIDMHFYIEQPARFAAGCFLNFNGSGGVIRREAILKAGGWQSDTLAEDLDASYRIQLAGYTVTYVKDLRCPGEVPLTVPSYKKQQARWACGSLRTAKKLLPRLISDSRLSLGKRLQAFIHLTYYMVHPLMLVSFLLSTASALLGLNALASFSPAGITLRAAGPLPTVLLALLWAAIAACTASFWISPLVAVHERGQKIRREIPSILLLAVIGFGINLSNSIEAAKALFTNRRYEFGRTPKYNVGGRRSDWRKRRYQIPLDACGVLEAAMAGLGIAATVIAAARGAYWPIPLIVPYSIGYGFVSVSTFLQSGKRGAAGQ